MRSAKTKKKGTTRKDVSDSKQMRRKAEKKATNAKIVSKRFVENKKFDGENKTVQ